MNFLYDPKFLVQAAGLLIIVICVVSAFKLGDETGSSYPERWRRRARYLRWLSMAALAAMGLLIVLVASLPLSGESGALGASIVLGLIAAMMAGVYRYIIRLGYFYEARADAAELLSNKTGEMPDLGNESNLTNFISLCRVISPDGLEYAEAQSLLGEIVNLKKGLLDKK